MLELYVRFMTWFAEVRESERGAAAVEYGLLVGLIAAIIVLTVTSLGTKVLAGFKKVTDALPAS
jgi:pilus assembly protein Flp/PilA